MRFSILTDTSANLSAAQLQREDVGVIPFSYFIDGKEHTCLDTDNFCGKVYYESMRKGMEVTTSQVTPQRYIDHMEPLLKEGKDILFVGMSSGISGSYQSAELAAAELRKKYPLRSIRLVDTLGASLGEGLLVLRAVECRRQGMELDKTADLLLELRQRMYQVFTVDDLMYLRKTGRLSNATALVGTMLQIKPLLKGNENGKIISFGKVRGRKRSIEALAEKYEVLVCDPAVQTVGIAHAGCPEDAKYLTDLLCRHRPPKSILTVCYEPVTGAHVGPGTLALFFEGNDGVRYK